VTNLTLSGLGALQKLWLHDLLEAMGREIVRRESFEEPDRRSKLWFSEDILLTEE
jgi:hypothetical protein